MSPRKPARNGSPGSVRKLCTCGVNFITTSQVCCPGCWPSVPPSLRSAYLTAKSRDGAAAAEKAAAAIREHLGKARVQ